MSYDFSFYGRIDLFVQITNKTQNLQKFTKFIFFSQLMNQILKNSKFFSKRAILTMHNDTVAILNDIILNSLFENAHIMMFVNFVIDEFRIDEIFIEHLRIFEIFSLFFAILRLKIETLVMLLKNLCSKKNLCNEIRLIVTNFRRFVLKIRILEKFMNDQIRFISRIAIHSFFENLF